MKRLYASLLLLLIMVLAGCVTAPVIKTVSVTVGAVGYSDDRINVTVEKRAAEMDKAENECDRVFRSIKTLLAEQGLSEEDYNMSENSTYENQEEKSDNEKFISRKGFEIRVTDDIDPDRLMEQLRSSGATGVYRNVFDRTAKQKAPSDLKSVFSEAENRARIIAENAGYTLGEIVKINEMDYGIEDGKIYNIEYQMK